MNILRISEILEMYPTLEQTQEAMAKEYPHIEVSYDRKEKQMKARIGTLRVKNNRVELVVAGDN